MGYYLAIKINEIVKFAATWMDLEIIILSEIRQISYDITYMGKMYLKMIQMNLFMIETESQTEKTDMIIKG